MRERIDYPDNNVIIGPYDEKRRVVTVNDEPTMTKQALADELDVNKIIKRYGGNLQAVQQAHNFEALYGEFTSFDLAEALQKADKARELFLQVPSAVRNEFNNDAGAYIDFATNPDNIEQMREWKLAPPEEKEPPPPEPIEVTVVNQPAE